MSEIKKLLKEKKKTIDLGKYKEVAEICNALGNEFVLKECYEEALEQHEDELDYCEKAGDQMGIAVANRKVGECFTHLSNFRQALSHIQNFYDISVSLNSDLEQQRAYATFGRTYYLKYQHEIASGTTDSKSLDHAELNYYKALQLLPKLGSAIKPVELAEMKCRLLLNLGLVNENRGNYEKCCSYIKDALELSLKHNLYEDIQRCALALGSIYQKINNNLEADRAYETALSAAKKLHNKNMMCEILLSKSTSLISQEKINDAKKCLKQAYKLHTTNVEDHDKITKYLKVCVGIYSCNKKLKLCTNYSDKKLLLEKIADGLSSIGFFKLAIKKYLLTLDCMVQANATSSQRAPIYFSLAKTYLDDEKIPKALEYFEKEFNCNKDKPSEQIKTLWEIADVLETQGNTEKMEEIYLKAVSVAKMAHNDKLLHSSYSKLLLFHKSMHKADSAKDVKEKLDNIKYECGSDDECEDEDSQDPFSDINLGELSDSDNNEEEITIGRRRTKQIETKVNEKGETPLHQACINGNLNMVKRLVDNGHSFNVRDNCGWTPLHEACNFGFFDIVEFLLDKGANINDSGGPGCKGITALHDAASCGNFDVMHLLIGRGASVAAVDQNGETALHSLLAWKRRLIRENDMDDVTLRQCKVMENLLKSKLQKAGMSADVEIYSAYDNNEFDGESNYTGRVREKRVRSPSMSPDIDSDEDDIDDMSQYLNVNDNKDLDDAKNAKSEYKSVMENLRRSAAVISPVKSQPPKEMNGPPLVNENEIVNEWLIKDINEAPKAKRKRRKMAKLNVRTSKCIDNYLTPQNTNESDNNIIVDEDSNFSISSIGSTDKKMEISLSHVTVNECSKVSFYLRVHIADKLILVPVPDDTSTISWLAEEAAQRFQSLDGNRPHLTLTKNGALLSGSDFVRNIFINNEEVMSTVDAWDEPALDDRYAQLCAKRNVIASTSIKKRFQCFESSAGINFSNCSIPSPHLSIVFSTLSNFKSLQHLDFSGTAIGDANMNELIACIPCFSILLTLNLSCCCLTSESLKKMTDYLQKHAVQSVLPSLKSLDLSYNVFYASCCFEPLLNLSSLVSLNISSCGLNSSMFSSQSFCCVLKSKHNLEDFDISGNILEEKGISSLLSYLPKLSIKKLNLRHTLKRESNLGSKLFDFLSDPFLSLKELILQGCHLIDTDIDQVALCLLHCPQLQVIDLSANPLLSSNSLCNFVNKAYESNLNITNINMTGSCIWKDEPFSDITNWLRFKNLKHLYLDNCSDNMIETIIESWKIKWGNRAVCPNYGFCKLSVV